MKISSDQLGRNITVDGKLAHIVASEQYICINGIVFEGAALHGIQSMWNEWLKKREGVLQEGE